MFKNICRSLFMMVEQAGQWFIVVEKEGEDDYVSMF